MNLKTFLSNLLIFSVYIFLSRFWIGSASLSFDMLKYELIFFLTFCFLLAPTALDSKAKYYTGAFVFVTLSMLIDFVFTILNRLPSVSDLNEVMPLFNFMPYYMGPAILAAFIYVSFCTWLIFYNSSRLVTAVKLTLPPALLAGLFTFDFLNEVRADRYSKFSSIFSQEKSYALLLNELDKYQDESLSLNQQYLNQQIPVKKNIHVMVLESFVDPRDYTITSKLASQITALIPKMDFDYYISPTFGGGTSKTEFELLSGHPSYRKLSTVDFNVLGGTPVQSFLKFLKSQNYQIHSTVATKNTFFNSVKAYRSLGMDKVDYLRDRRPYLDDQVMFEGDVLEETQKKLDAAQAPYFSYTLGMYGHTPHFRDLNKRPNLVNHPNPLFEKLVNQFIYRSREIYNYFEFLKKSDPDSIILIIADHLPPQVFGDVTFKRDPYSNLALFYIGGEKISVSGLHSYEIHWKLMEALTGEKYKLPLNKKDYLPSYYNLIYQSKDL